MLPASTITVFQSALANIKFKGLHIPSTADCVAWLGDEVRNRAYDAEEIAKLDDFMRVEGFDKTELYSILTTPDVELNPHDIGEAMAELALEAELKAIWPTNRRRDMRSVRASLPGADIVGFVPCDTSGYRFLFAEVKTSSDIKTPPAVMYGAKGLEYQMHTLATDNLVLKRLLSYIYSRVRGTDMMGMWTQAFRQLVSEFSTGAQLVGLLVRDTNPEEKDVSHHAGVLSTKLTTPNNISLMALYICIPAKDWSLHCPPI